MREGTRQVAHRAGDHRHAMAALSQVARQLVMARPAGFVEGGKGLVDEENVHWNYDGRLTIDDCRLAGEDCGKINSLVNSTLRAELTSRASESAGIFKP